MPTDQRMKFTSGHVPTCRPSVFRLIVLGHLPLSHFCTFQEFPRRNDFNLHQQIPPLLRNNSSNRFHILRRYSWVYSRTVTSVSSACCSSFETGSLRGSELPRQPLARLVLGDALERLRLPDGVVELVQQLRLLVWLLECGLAGLLGALFLLAGRERGQQWELIPSGRRIVAYIRRADGKKNGLVSSIK